jgi:hypothetical protein
MELQRQKNCQILLCVQMSVQQEKVEWKVSSRIKLILENASIS